MWLESLLLSLLHQPRLPAARHVVHLLTLRVEACENVRRSRGASGVGLHNMWVILSTGVFVLWMETGGCSSQQGCSPCWMMSVSPKPRGNQAPEAIQSNRPCGSQAPFHHGSTSIDLGLPAPGSRPLTCTLAGRSTNAR